MAISRSGRSSVFLYPCLGHSLAEQSAIFLSLPRREYDYLHEQCSHLICSCAIHALNAQDHLRILHEAAVDIGLPIVLGKKFSLDPIRHILHPQNVFA